MAYLCVNSRKMAMNEGKPGSQVPGYCAAPSPAPWECAWTCKRGPGAPCIWPHCVPGSSPWWALRQRSAAGTDLEQCQNIGVTTAATILMPTHTQQPTMHTAINTMMVFIKDKEEATALSSVGIWLHPGVFRWVTRTVKNEYIVIWVCKRCQLKFTLI